MEPEWNNVFYSFYYFLRYYYCHLENIPQKIQICNNAPRFHIAIHVTISKGFRNMAALKPYILHWTVRNNKNK